MLYGSCDGAWYVEESWTDPLTEEKSNQHPVIAVEGTLALERGSSGSAQYQRFFHALGAICSGGIGIYYLRKGNHPMRPDLPKAALNAFAKHGKPYLVTNELVDIRNLVEAIAVHGEDSPQANEVFQEILRKMSAYWEDGFKRTYGGSMEKYYARRSILRTPGGEYIKYAGRNYRNFTEGSQRAGHIALGEFYMAKYFLNCPFYYFLPRLTPDEIALLDGRKAKEWRLMRADELGKIVTIEDFKGIDNTWKETLRAFKDQSLGGHATGSGNYARYNELMQTFIESLQQGKIHLIRT